MSDFNTALRSLGKSPGFTVVAVLTLALGIGFSSASFSIANTFLLRNVPYPQSGSLVRLFRSSEQGARLGHAPGNILEIRDTATSFSGIAIFNGDSLALAEPGQPAEQVSALSVTADFFDVLQVHPAKGRGFAPGEDLPDKPHVAVLTHRAWVRRYGANPDVVGRDVRLNQEPYTIIGILPPSFEAPLVWGPVEFVVPRTLVPGFRTQRRDPWMHSVARLKEGVTLAGAQAEVSTIAARLAQQYPDENGRDGLRLVALHVSNMDGASRGLVWLMTAVSTTMLLIGCANLASLQVARAIGRTREFAVRAALGGERRHLMAPLLAESMLLSLAGGLLGLLVASWTNAIIGSLLLINNEPGLDIPLDWRVLAFAGCASIASGIAFGLAPAWLASRAPAAEVLKDGSRSSTGGPSHHRIKRTLIVTEIALAVALVGVAASFGLGAKAFAKRPVGWTPDGLAAGYIVLPYNRYTNDEQCRAFTRTLLERLNSIPGVDHAATATGMPVYSLGRATRIVVEGQPAVERGREPIAESAVVSPEYFDTLEIPLKHGNSFAPTSGPNDPPAAIVNEAFAQRFWPGTNPVGRRVRFADDGKWLQIVGVVGDVSMAVRPDQPETRLHIYRPIDQVPSHYLAIVLRGSVQPETLVMPLRQAVGSIDPDLPVARPGLIRDEITRALSNIDLVIVNLGISAGMGLLIAAVGLFGVMSQLTIQRTRDIGVRMALGAQGSDILRMVLGEGARLHAIGVVLGIPLLLALNTVVQNIIPEAPMPGLWLAAANIALLSATMLVATWLPARRATLVDPVEALRAE